MAQRSPFAGKRPTLSESAASQETPGEPSQEASAEQHQADSTPRPSANEAGSETLKKQPKKGKVTFYLWPEDHHRAKAAYMHTMGHTNIRSWTQFLETAVREFTHKLEEEHNDRRPFAQPE